MFNTFKWFQNIRHTRAYNKPLKFKHLQMKLASLQGKKLSFSNNHHFIHDNFVFAYESTQKMSPTIPLGFGPYVLRLPNSSLVVYSLVFGDPDSML
jgi:hypothetical protein